MNTPLRGAAAQNIVFFEEGEPLIDGEPGDLRFVVRTRPSQTFRREGNDLWMQYNITLEDALVGFSKEVRVSCMYGNLQEEILPQQFQAGI